MANPFIKSFLFINIISNFFLYINCEDYNIKCEKMIINKNGIIITRDTAKAKSNTMFSINYGESFIIYNCDTKTNHDVNDCMSYYDYSDNGNDIIDSTDSSLDSTPSSLDSTSSSLDSIPSPSSCIKKKIKNEDDNICCYYRKKNSAKIIPGCIELNKYEIERFKWNTPDLNFSNYNQSDKFIIQFECESELFKLNKYIFLIFFIIFFNF